jgi:hypothetical protein
VIAHHPEGVQMEEKPMPSLHQATRRSPLVSPLLAVTLVCAASCRDSTEPEAVTTRIEVGTLASPSAVALQAPDTVFATVAFNATVRTTGDASVQAAGGEVTVRGLVATVTPYDMVYVGSSCAAWAVVVPAPTRTVNVRFDVAGTATIRALGAKGTTAERTVVVRPLR